MTALAIGSKLGHDNKLMGSRHGGAVWTHFSHARNMSTQEDC